MVIASESRARHGDRDSDVMEEDATAARFVISHAEKSGAILHASVPSNAFHRFERVGTSREPRRRRKSQGQGGRGR